MCGCSTWVRMSTSVCRRVVSTSCFSMHLMANSSPVSLCTPLMTTENSPLKFPVRPPGAMMLVVIYSNAHNLCLLQVCGMSSRTAQVLARTRRRLGCPSSPQMDEEKLLFLFYPCYIIPFIQHTVYCSIGMLVVYVQTNHQSHEANQTLLTFEGKQKSLKIF